MPKRRLQKKRRKPLRVVGAQSQAGFAQNCESRWRRCSPPLKLCDMWDPAAASPADLVRRRRRLPTATSPRSPLTARAPLVQAPPPDAPLAPIRLAHCASRAKRLHLRRVPLGEPLLPSAPLPKRSPILLQRCHAADATSPRLASRPRHASNDRDHRHRALAPNAHHLAIAILTSSR